MEVRMKKFFVLPILAALFAAGFLSACAESGGGAASGAEVVYRTTNGASIPSLAPHQHSFDPVRVALTMNQGSFYYMFYDTQIENVRYFPAFATDLPVPNHDWTVWTISLRNDLAFTNGTPINAHTYDYSWRMLLDPHMASPGAGALFGSFNVVGARAYYLQLSMADYMAIAGGPGEPNWSRDNITPSARPITWAEVGIEVVDDYTLRFTLENPTKDIDVISTFSSMAALAAVDPAMYEARFNADRTQNTYGLGLEDLAQSGAFILAEWARDQYFVWEKNPDFPLADMYTYDVIEERFVTDPNTVMQMFELGEIDAMALNSTTFQSFSNDPRTVRTEGPVVWGFHNNSQHPTNLILNDRDFRHAVFYACDRETIARDIYKIFIPANYYVSSRAWVGDLARDPIRYRNSPQGRAVQANFSQGSDYGYNERLARELFDRAYERNGGRPVSMELMYFETSLEQRLSSEFLKEEFERIFGADRFRLNLVAMPTTAAYDKMEAGEHEAGWGTQGQDSWNPWTSLNIWRSDYDGALHRFHDDEFNELQRRTARGDLVFNDMARIDALARMESIVMGHMPWIPIYQNNGAVIYSDRVHLLLDEFLFPVGYAVGQSYIEPNVARSITVTR